MDSNTIISDQSIKIFGKNLIDYAGIFPPASLDLKTAFSNHIKYLESQYSWMLSKFVISAKRLPELTALIDNENISLERKISFAILGGSEVSLSKFFEALIDDINMISKFKSRFGDNVITETYEVRVPLELFVIPDIQKIKEFFRNVMGHFLDKLKNNITVFYEAIPKKDLVHLVSAISNFNLESGSIEDSTPQAGYKIRTGGVEASSFPAPEKIAYLLKICREHDVPLKSTAGLHHPLRHYDQSVKTKMHGFINVFCAGIFAYNLDLNEHELTRMLLDESPDHFKFSDDSISWDIYEVFKEEIADAREKFITSFGSCSFEEPIADLKSLNLLQ
jgi:hypothetical protein